MIGCATFPSRRDRENAKILTLVKELEQLSGYLNSEVDSIAHKADPVNSVTLKVETAGYDTEHASKE